MIGFSSSRLRECRGFTRDLKDNPISSLFFKIKNIKNSEKRANVPEAQRVTIIAWGVGAKGAAAALPPSDWVSVSHAIPA